jgi:magnesium chelatase family protein
LLVGPPGTGKSMLARRLPGLLPALDAAAALESAALESLAGRPVDRLSYRAPFRAPHHTATAAALVGGGQAARPGEISLAHHGVLFLDELPEFPRAALEALREPLETGWISIARARQSVRYPARFQLLAAMNPCPCGFAGDARRECRCSPEQVQRYQSRVSGPLLDRLDLRVGLSWESPFAREGEAAVPAEGSAAVCARVAAARQRQRARGTRNNACLERAALAAHCQPNRAGRQLLAGAADRLRLSPRACDRVLRVARTVADLEGVDAIDKAHVAQALTLHGGWPRAAG